MRFLPSVRARPGFGVPADGSSGESSLAMARGQGLSLAGWHRSPARATPPRGCAATVSPAVSQSEAASRQPDPRARQAGPAGQVATDRRHAMGAPLEPSWATQRSAPAGAPQRGLPESARMVIPDLAVSRHLPFGRIAGCSALLATQ